MELIHELTYVIRMGYCRREFVTEFPGLMVTITVIWIRNMIATVIANPVILIIATAFHSSTF